MKKKITKATLEDKGRVYKLFYTHEDSFEHLPYERCMQVYGVCFYDQKLVLVHSINDNWILPGGKKEQGETYEQTLIREVHEETNMKVLSHTPLGVQKVINPEGTIDYQLRFAALVEPIGEFEADPDEDITKIALIDPQEYKNYFDWGEIGDRIIERALELKLTLSV